MDFTASAAPWLLVIDPQHVFADPASPWCAHGFEATIDPIRALADEHAGRVIVTRWLPERDRSGSWGPYFETWPFADRPDDDPLFDLVDEARGLEAGPTLDERTFGKFSPQLLARTGPNPHLVLAGVATDCCVLSTALAAADGGATVEVVARACAGSTPENHERALAAMTLYGPQITIR